MQKVLDEVNVNALRAKEKTPFAFTNISKSEIEKGNLGQYLPYLISLAPSVVTTSDAGLEWVILVSELEVLTQQESMLR